MPAGALTLEQRAAMIKGITDVMLDAMKLPSDPARRLFVEVIETAEGGFGVNGQVFVPRKYWGARIPPQPTRALARPRASAQPTHRLPSGRPRIKRRLRHA